MQLSVPSDDKNPSSRTNVHHYCTAQSFLRLVTLDCMPQNTRSTWAATGGKGAFNFLCYI